MGEKKFDKVYIHDTQGDIFIQSQQIKLALDYENDLLHKVISV